MQKYRVTSPLGLALTVGAVVALAADYVEPVKPAGPGAGKKKLPPRFAGALEPVEGRPGVYKVVGPMMLKRGMMFGFEGDLPKAMVDRLEDPAAPGQPVVVAPKGGATKKGEKPAARSDEKAGDKPGARTEGKGE